MFKTVKSQGNDWGDPLFAKIASRKMHKEKQLKLLIKCIYIYFYSIYLLLGKIVIKEILVPNNLEVELEWETHKTHFQVMQTLFI